MSTETYVYCDQCDWTPDSARRKSADNQASEHTKATGHVTHSGMRTVRS